MKPYNPMMSPFYQIRIRDIVFSRFVLGIVIFTVAVSFLDRKKPTEK